MAAAAVLSLLCCTTLLPAGAEGRAVLQPHRALHQAANDAGSTHATSWAAAAGSPQSEASTLLVRAFQGPTNGASAAQLLQGTSGVLGGAGIAGAAGAAGGAAANSTACPCRDAPPPNGDCVQQRDTGQW